MREIRLIEVKEGILSENENLALALRDRLRMQKTFLLNVMSSPGSGKTSLILRTIQNLGNDLKMAVLEADIDSVVDAQKIAETGVQAVQLRTGGFCHLDAAMTSSGLDALDLNQLDMVIIENVGNLVCPAEFDTGAIKNAMILSVPEGDDKPLKYPLMFSICEALVINKMDYMELSDFNLQVFKERVRRLNPNIRIFEVSCKTGMGIGEWTDWLRKEVAQFQET